MARQSFARDIGTKTRLEFALALGITEQELETVLDNYHDALTEFFHLHTKACPKIDPHDATNTKHAAERILALLRTYGPLKATEFSRIFSIVGFTKKTTGDALRALITNEKILMRWDGCFGLPEHGDGRRQ